MPSSSRERTPRERLARLLTLVRRMRLFYRSAIGFAIVGFALSFVLALYSKRAWRSETTVIYHDAIQTNKDGESAAARAARLGPKLKDLLYARPRLASVIGAFDLFPEKTAKSMVEAEEEMQQAIGFRARASDTFVIAFIYDDPEIAQRVAARLAGDMIQDYNRENIDLATLTRDFLRKKRDDATANVEEKSRALASFLAQNPTFQWGVNDSPYAAGPVPGAPFAPAPPPAGLAAKPRAPSSPESAATLALESELARVDAELAGAPPGGPTPIGATEAQKRRDAAALTVTAAEALLADKLLSVTPAHPDAVSARAKVEAAKSALASAEAQLRTSKGETTAPPSTALAPERRAALERQRASLRARIADRRRHAKPDVAHEPKASEAKKASPKATVVDLETEWHRLKLDLERAREELRSVEQTAQAADISADAMEKKSQSEMQVLEPAYRPTRPDRGKGRVFLAGATITVFLAFAYAISRVLLNDTLLDDGDVEALGGEPSLVMLPRLTAIAAPPLRSLVVRAVPEPVGESRARPTHAPSVIITTPPHADVSTLVQALSPGHPPMRPQRVHQSTMRFGSRVPVDGAEPHHGESARQVLADAVLTSTALSRRVPSDFADASLALALGAAVRDDAECDVEVLGADLDANGAGAFALLRDATPELLASLRVLRHRLDQRRGGGPFAVTVVSPGRGEGKTLLAARLAMTLSESDRARVVLVEGHFERPQLAAALGLSIPKAAGLSAQIARHMNGQGGPWGVVKLGPTLSVLLEPEKESAFPAVIHSWHFESLLSSLRRRYDYVVIDGPPVLGSGDANVLEDASDGVLLVVRAAATRGAALARAMQQLGERRILGVVLNDVVA